jgi:hypothetical protein
MTPIADRPTYAPSGRLEVRTFFAYLCVLAGVAGLLAVGLAALVAANGYAVGWIWIVPAVLFPALVRQSVAASRCRSPRAAIALGLCTGLVVLGGFYHIDQCTRWGVGWERLDRLPGYVTFRMETDGWWVPHPKVVTVAPAPVQAGVDPWLAPAVSANWHWAAFLAEVIFFVIAPAVAARRRSLWPYSEQTGAWFVRDSLVLTRESAAALLGALRDGSVGRWTAESVEKGFRHLPHTVVDVWYCPRPASDAEAVPEVYLSVGSVFAAQLELEEAAALTAVVPALADLAVPAAERIQTGPLSADAAVEDPTTARLTAVPGPFVGRAQDPGVVRRGRVLCWGIELIPVYGLVIATGGGFLSAWAAEEGLVLKDAPMYWGIGVVLPLLLGLLIYVGVTDHPGFRALTRYYRRVITEQAARRPDPLFPPHHLRAVYAEVAPRRTWHDLRGGQHECEGGLLLIDPDRLALLFEGDRHRFLVPSAAVLRCEVEEVTRVGNTDGLYAVVVVARTAAGTHEWPIIPLDGVDGANQWERALNLKTAMVAGLSLVTLPDATA